MSTLLEIENRRAGTHAWILDRPAPNDGVRAAAIEGYCSKTSVLPGQTLDFYVSTNPAAHWRMDIYRTGYYQGAGGRLVGSLGPFEGVVQHTPTLHSYRIGRCEWTSSCRLKVPDYWLSGVYLGKLTELSSGFQNYVIFVLKDTRKADLIVQCSDLTWQSYNRWPANSSLYDDGEHEWYWGSESGSTFARPYGKYRQLLDAPLSTGSGEWFLWEFPFSYWAEQMKYDITYISNLDLHCDSATLNRAKGFISVGHDEYYTIEMYGNLLSKIESGLNVAFFSGNSVYGQVKFVDDCSFIRSDIFSAPEEMNFGSLPGSNKFPFRAPDAGYLLGSRSTHPIMGGADWICSDPGHWVFSGSGMKKGDSIAGLVGWESHGAVAEGRDVDVVAAGEVSGPYGTGPYAATVYSTPLGNVVFNAATIWWSDGLASPPGYVRSTEYVARNGPDKRVQCITTNVLNRFIRYQPPT
jgi:hypothetical protein